MKCYNLLLILHWVLWKKFFHISVQCLVVYFIIRCRASECRWYGIGSSPVFKATGIGEECEIAF
jgi:hypothetical protein